MMTETMNTKPEMMEGQEIKQNKGRNLISMVSPRSYS
jgi:hypothetical protein